LGRAGNLPKQHHGQGKNLKGMLPSRRPLQLADVGVFVKNSRRGQHGVSAHGFHKNDVPTTANSATTAHALYENHHCLRLILFRVFSSAAKPGLKNNRAPVRGSVVVVVVV
jgi:hypothetical protein